VNAVVAPTDDEAQRLALPQLHAMLALRTGSELRPQRLVEEAEKVELPPAHADLVARMAERWVIGAPDQARDRVAELASTYDVDEVMVHPVAGAYTGTEPGVSPAREETLRLLAG
jgi:alkanesulfonate monooxygenase SsuD/methylene tetrahydromethanopterin reductase-like flavin-dependent oxidoreductase (luciferase family)